MKYEIDWSDQFFPKIKIAKEEGKTFTECRCEVIEFYLDKIKHAKIILKEFRSLRKKDIQ